MVVLGEKDKFKGAHKKLKPIQYGPFKILEQDGENAFKLDLPIGICICIQL